MRNYFLHSRFIAFLAVVLASLAPTIDSSANNTPLCFTARNGEVTVMFDIKNVTHVIQYSKDGTTWNDYVSNTRVTIKRGQNLYFRAAVNQTTASAFGKFFNRESSRFVFTSTNGGIVEASGNIMSLYGSDCPDLPLQPYAFANMFEECTSLTTAPALPATILGDYCYSSMFEGCISLSTAPALPSANLADHCYFKIFSGCSSLTKAPALPSTIMAKHCYRLMFEKCTSLTAAPALPSMNLALECYAYMFYGCTSLTKLPILPATTLAELCYYNMFADCTSLKVNNEGKGKKWGIPATSTANDALTDMFTGTGGAMNGTPSINTTYYVSSGVR